MSEKVLRGSSSFFGPRLRLLISSKHSHFQIWISQSFKLQNLKVSKSQNFKILWATPSATGARPLHSRVQIFGIVERGSWHFWYTKLSSLHLWFFWDTREHNKGYFEVQAWISCDYCWFCCPWVLFGMLGASTLASWGSLGRSWDIGGHKEGPCDFQACILCFCWFRASILRAF